MLNKVQARSARLNGAADSLGERAVALKMADVLALPAIVLRNDQQDALGVGLNMAPATPGLRIAISVRGKMKAHCDLGRITAKNNLAILENMRGAGHGSGNADILLNEQNRKATFLVQYLDGLDHQINDHRGQSHRRLIHKEELRLCHQRPSDRDLLLLPAGERTGQSPALLSEARKQFATALLNQGSDSATKEK